MVVQTAKPLGAAPSGPLSTEAPIEVIHKQAGHFPKHLPLGDSKPTPKPKRQKPSNKNGKGKSSLPPIKILKSRAWQSAGAAGGE